MCVVKNMKENQDIVQEGVTNTSRKTLSEEEKIRLLMTSVRDIQITISEIGVDMQTIKKDMRVKLNEFREQTSLIPQLMEKIDNFQKELKDVKETYIPSGTTGWDDE